jgi:hypothetical protein
VHVVWEIALAVITGAIAAGVWALCATLWMRHQISTHVFPLRGRYTSTRKEATEPEDRRIAIDVRNNVLIVTFEGQPEGIEIKGEITMNEHNLTQGAGGYSHVVNGTDYWGFWDVHVKDNDTLLVHTTYVRADTGVLVTVANVWRRWDT